MYETTRRQVFNNLLLATGSTATQGWHFGVNSTPIANFKSDYNVSCGGRNYAPNGGFSVGTAPHGGFAMWQAAGEDLHSVEANPQLNASYQIQSSGSVASQRGANLSKLNINTRNSGMPVPVGIGATNNGGARSVSRPSQDAGAFAGIYFKCGPGATFWAQG